jgi:hypothetical protein
VTGKKMSKYKKDPSMLSYKRIAERLGISPNTIFVMRIQQPERFKYILELDPYFEIGYRKYQSLQEETLIKLQTIYYELEDNRQVYAFSKFLTKKGIYKSERSWYNSIKNIWIPDLQSMKHPSLLMKIETINVYPEFRKLNQDKD